MRFHPTQNGLLLAALLASCGQLVHGAPIVPTADIDPWQGSTSASHRLAGVLEPRRREVDEAIPELDGSTLREVFARSFPPRLPGKPPVPPPPPPVPRPRPVPAPMPRPRPAPAPRPVTPPRPLPPAPKPEAKPIPHNENPGQGTGTGAEPKSMQHYEQEGTKQLHMYETKAKSHEPDTVIVATEAEVAHHPKNGAFLDINKNDELRLEKQDVRLDDGPSLKVLKEFNSQELGFSMKDVGNLKQVAVYPSKSHAQFINRGTYDPNGRIILYQDAFKDLNVGQGAKKIPLNEMGMQNFKSVAGEKTKNLKAVFLMDVQNKEFWAITRESYNARKQPFKEILTFPRGSPEFNRFMGSPNFSSKFYSFANHHNAIGNKVPDKVIVMTREHPNSGGKLTVAVTFKDA
ncbi:hypothetical protein E4U30_006153 [Claviceps sp. LM220 group G6]|nr:hypothetical protein E4U30_006153 [Claviceps sp. LM220 group G6]